MGSLVLECVHSGAPRGRRVRSSSHRITHALISVVGFIRVGVGSIRRTYRSWVHSFSRGFTRERLGDVVFIWVRVGLLGRTKKSSCFVWVHAPRSRRIHSGSRCFNWAGLGVFGMIRLGSFGSAVAEFIGVRLGSLRRA